MSENIQTLPYRLGCPMWGHKKWLGRLFTSNARDPQYLSQYSSVFNSVEGNTTFYGLPSASTVQRWALDADENFKFCFKFPQRITHRLELCGAAEETLKFFKALQPIGDKLGPFLLQLPAKFSPHSLPELAAYLDQLPKEFDYTVEVRHLDFFHNAVADESLSTLLQSHAIDRVMFDSRPLFAARVFSGPVLDAQKKKPRVPAMTYALSQHPSLRFIGHPELRRSREYFRPWLRKIAAWIDEGKEPYVFFHTADNVDAPALAAAFHADLTEFIPTLPSLPTTPYQHENEYQKSLQLRNADEASDSASEKVQVENSEHKDQLDLF